MVGTFFYLNLRGGLLDTDETEMGLDYLRIQLNTLGRTRT